MYDLESRLSWVSWEIWKSIKMKSSTPGRISNKIPLNHQKLKIKISPKWKRILFRLYGLKSALRTAFNQISSIWQPPDHDRKWMKLLVWIETCLAFYVICLVIQIKKINFSWEFSVSLKIYTCKRRKRK
jgi:hypothetical protein